jgi:ATP-binding cassette subfamily F protein uup
MNLLAVRSLRKDFGIKEVLKNASFSLSRGSKVGLIGTNGSGKSTLLKILAGLEQSDTGEIWFNSGSKVIYLPQQPDLDENKTVLEQVFADNDQQMSLLREYEEISEKLTLGKGDLDRLSNRLASLSQEMESSGVWELENNAKIILNKLGIQDFSLKIGGLSGGYRKRIALASALLSTPDILLMDEPTNHLDAISVEWLQGYLSRYQGALLLITHDRYFLDRVTNTIFEIDRGELYSYAGNYAYYLEKKAAAEDSDTSTQRKFGGILRRELEWLKKGPKARSTKQKARIDRIAQMQDREFREVQGKVAITTAQRRIGKKVIELKNVSKSYDGRTLINDFSYIFNPEDRIGIIGGNGVGKSTMMDIITGRIEPDSGKVEIGSTIHIGYFDQHCDDLVANQEQRVIDYLKDVAELVKTSDGSVITASQMLERFLFPPSQQYAPIGKLSGGEKRRLFLLRVLISAPNLLILDEPTNDLDVQTLTVLEDYLEDFNGCVIVVSHDRYFLDRTVETIFSFEGEGNLQQYMGNYSDYLERKQKDQLSITTTAPNSPKKALASEKNKTLKLSFKEVREYENLEKEIDLLETEKQSLEKRIENISPSDFLTLQDTSRLLAQLDEKIEQATLRWLELAERQN